MDNPLVMLDGISKSLAEVEKSLQEVKKASKPFKEEVETMVARQRQATTEFYQWKMMLLRFLFGTMDPLEKFSSGPYVINSHQVTFQESRIWSESQLLLDDHHEHFVAVCCALVKQMSLRAKSLNGQVRDMGKIMEALQALEKNKSAKK